MKNRVTHIDLIRGIAILLMTIDHIIHCNPFIKPLSDPIDIINSSTILIILRLMGHFCAPAFVLLCGISLYIRQIGGQYSSASISKYAIKRGFILIAMEFTIVTFGWTLVFRPYKIFLQVIFAIGMSLIALGIMIKYLNRTKILYICICLIITDNLITYFDLPKPDNRFLQIIWAVFHEKTVFWLFDNSIFIRTTYPVLSWIGLIGIGYFLGDIYYKGDKKRIKNLTKLSIIISISGLLIRYFITFGERSIYVKYDNLLYNILSFSNFTKYPPSLIFFTTFCTIVILILNSFFIFKAKNKFLEFLGRNSMKYYIIHIYIITIFYKGAKYILT